ncbi:MAG: hypothetical protein P3B98_11585 [Gemmatimonadota bacterium]|nr:hypothetical protein [Gemmatimonadota bacterium]
MSERVPPDAPPRRGAPVRTAVVSALTTAAFVVAGLDAHAQRPTQYDHLREYWATRSRAATARWDEAHRAADTEFTDSVRVGPMLFLAPSGLAATNRTLARLADSAYSATWLPETGGWIRRYEMRERSVDVETVAPSGETVTHQRTQLMLLLREPDGRMRESASTTATGADSLWPIAWQEAQWALKSRATAQLAPELRTWIGAAVPVERPGAIDWVAGWKELVLYPSLPARSCSAGDVRACRVALALVSEADPVRNWYDPALRQVLAQRWLRSFRGNERRVQFSNRTDQVAPVRACANGDDDACVQFLQDRALGANMVEPGPKVLRALLVRFAFTRGNDSSAKRQAAYAPGATVEERLSQASGLPFDELVRQFAVQLRAPRQARPSRVPARLWASSLWCLCVGALSLRSTRWRV